jgi:hypothetical protein
MLSVGRTVRKVRAVVTMPTVRSRLPGRRNIWRKARKSDSLHCHDSLERAPRWVRRFQDSDRGEWQGAAQRTGRRGSSRDARRAGEPPSSTPDGLRHVRRNTHRTCSIAPDGAKLYPLFTNISADCARSNARLSARNSRDCPRAVANGPGCDKTRLRRDLRNKASDDRHHFSSRP